MGVTSMQSPPVTVHTGFPLMGTVMVVVLVRLALVRVAETVTAPEVGSWSAGMLMSNLPAYTDMVVALPHDQ